MKEILTLIFALSICIFPNIFAYAGQSDFYDGKDVISITAKDKIFSPNNDGMFDSLIFEISLLQNKLKIKKWRLDIISIQTNETVCSFFGKKEIPKTLKWDGIKDGKIIEGDYKYIFTALINKKNIKIEEEGVIVDITDPYLSLTSSLDTVLIDKDNNKFSNDIVFDFNIGDENGIDKSKTKLQILNFNNKVVKEWNFKKYDDIPHSFMWDGRDDIYGQVVPAGEYKALLTVYDIVNNNASLSKNITTFEQVVGVISEIVVKEEPRGLVVNLSSNILFSSGKSLLKPEAAKSLDETVKLLNAYPANKVLIEGYTDSTGKKSENLKLSYNRAKSVYTYFVKNGIQAERLSAVGYGEENPIASNKTPKGRALNRRVNIIILKDLESKNNENQNDVEISSNIMEAK